MLENLLFLLAYSSDNSEFGIMIPVGYLLALTAGVLIFQAWKNKISKDAEVRVILGVLNIWYSILFFLGLGEGVAWFLNFRGWFLLLLGLWLFRSGWRNEGGVQCQARRLAGNRPFLGTMLMTLALVGPLLVEMFIGEKMLGISFLGLGPCLPVLFTLGALLHSRRGISPWLLIMILVWSVGVAAGGLRMTDWPWILNSTANFLACAIVVGTSRRVTTCYCPLSIKLTFGKL